MRRIYEALLRLYPRDYRRLFAGEMVVVFEQGAEEQRSRSESSLRRFAAREMAHLLSGAGSEWVARLTSSRRYAKEGWVANQPDFAAVGVDGMMAAQQRVDLMLRRMEYAIAHHQFQKARWYSTLEQVERAKLRELQEQHGMTE